jgi:integrase
VPKSKDRLYQKTPGGTFYGWVYLPTGGRKYVCTHCRDRRAAATRLRQIERDTQANETSNAPPVAPLTDVLSQFIAHTEHKRRSPFTVRSYRQKAGHLIRVLGETIDVNAFPAEVEEPYVRQRRAEGASDHTICKELVVLRAALKLAKRREQFVGDLERLRTDLSPNYQPRRRFLTVEEYRKIIDALSPKRRATVAFIVLTSARDSEWRSVERSHVDFSSVLTLPGTKTRRAYRKIPLREHVHLADLLGNVIKELPADQMKLFPEWTNIRRDLHDACRRAGIEHVSPNDLRRTFATWCWHGAMDTSRIALLLGHRDSRMVERVYGVLDSATLGNDISRVFGHLDLPTVITTGAEPLTKRERPPPTLGPRNGALRLVWPPPQE